eukprot:745225_1
MEYYLNCPNAEYLLQDVLLIIDRRGQENVLHVLNASANDPKLIKLKQNHVLGMEFNILRSKNGNNVVRCYLAKGIGEKTRFYTEHLTFLMCRLFKRDKLSDLEYVRRVYSSSYRHAFGTDLKDLKFEESHKLILNSLHISVNYDRDYVASELQDDIDDAKVDKYESNTGIESEWAKQCNTLSIKAASDCPYIAFVVDALRTFSAFGQDKIDNSQISEFNELSLTLASDHLVSVHSFCSDVTQRKAIKQFVQSETSPCEYGKKCVVLQQFSKQMREIQKTSDHNSDQLQFHSNNIKMNMIMDSLSTLHCYLEHHVFAFFRENVAKNNKFGSIVQHVGSSKSLKYLDEFDVLMNKLLHSDAYDFGMDEVLPFMNVLNGWCADNEFDFDALVDDMIDVERTKSNLYLFILSIKKEAYFDAVYREIFNIHHEGMDEQDTDALDALNAYLVNNISVQLFCQFDKWVKEKDFDWNKIVFDISLGAKSEICADFGNVLFTEIEQFIKTQEINSIGAVNFGVSIHEWLEFGEVPRYKSFRDEIINGSASTIDESLYNMYSGQCLLLAVVFMNEFGILELMCLKLYTDTSDLCKAFRMAFWKSKTAKSKTAKKEFYWWALTLFKTMLYHSKPLNTISSKSIKPKTLYHGLSDVFILDDSCPFYYGPISTTSDVSVALRFSNGAGLRWDIVVS